MSLLRPACRMFAQWSWASLSRSPPQLRTQARPESSLPARSRFRTSPIRTLLPSRPLWLPTFLWTPMDRQRLPHPASPRAMDSWVITSSLPSTAGMLTSAVEVRPWSKRSMPARRPLQLNSSPNPSNAGQAVTFTATRGVSTAGTNNPIRHGDLPGGRHRPCPGSP